MISTVLRSSAALLVAGAAATLAAQPAIAAPASPPARAAASTPGSAAAGPRIAAEVRGVMSRMTLADKIGQLFVTYVYGPGATTGTPADVQANQALYGVSNGAQLIAKYHVGGIIYFTWSGNLNNPAQIAGLSNGL